MTALFSLIGSWRTAAYIAIALAIFTAWKIDRAGQYRAGQQDTQSQWDLSKALAATELIKRHAAQTQTVTEAQNVRTQIQQNINHNNAATQRTIASLRNALAAARSRALQANPLTATCPAPASDELQRTMATIIEDMASQGSALATAADGHVADVRMLVDAWPK